MAGMQNGTGEELRQRAEELLVRELSKAPDRQDQELIFQCQRALSMSQRQSGLDSDDFLKELESLEKTAEHRPSACDVEQLDRLRTNGWWLPRRKKPWRAVAMSAGKVAAVLLFLAAAVRVGGHEATGDSIFRVMQEIVDGLLLTQQISNTQTPVVYDDWDSCAEDPMAFLAIPKTLPDGYRYNGVSESLELDWGVMLTVSYSNVDQESMTIHISIPKDNRTIHWGIEVDSEEVEVFESNGIEFLLCSDGDLTKCQWRVGTNHYILHSIASREAVKEFLSYIGEF